MAPTPGILIGTGNLDFYSQSPRNIADPSCQRTNLDYHPIGSPLEQQLTHSFFATNDRFKLSLVLCVSYSQATLLKLPRSNANIFITGLLSVFMVLGHPFRVSSLVGLFTNILDHSGETRLS